MAPAAGLNKWISPSAPSFRGRRAHARSTAEMPHLFCEKCVHIYTTQNTAWQSEANWSRWPLLNHITGDHISLFIGHKRSTSVSTRLTFPYEIFELGFLTSTPLLPPLLCAWLYQLAPRTSKLLFFSFFLTSKLFYFGVFLNGFDYRIQSGLAESPVYPKTQLALNDLFTQRGPLTLNLFDSCASQSPSTPEPDPAPARFF